MCTQRIINSLESTWQSIFGVDVANDDQASTLTQDALLKCIPSLITRLSDGHWHGMLELDEDVRKIPDKVITAVLGSHATLAEVAYSKYDLVSRGLTRLVGEGLCERRIPEISMDVWAHHKVQVRFFELYGCYEPSMSYEHRFVPAVAQDIDMDELEAWQERCGGRVGEERGGERKPRRVRVRSQRMPAHP